MKKALVIAAALVIALGLSAAAQGVYGTWFSWLSIGFRDGQNLTLHSFYSVADLGYEVCGFDLSMQAHMDARGLTLVAFEAYGSVGAFSGGSSVFFDAQSNGFMAWNTVVEVSIAGVDFYAIMELDDYIMIAGGDAIFLSRHVPPIGYGYASGVGWAFGGIGVAGDCRVGAEITFNLLPQLCWLWHYGTPGLKYSLCDTWYAEYWVSDLMGNVLQTTCHTIFSHAEVWVEYPFCCTTVLARAHFTCAGFEELCISLYDVDLGICCGWLDLWNFDICFQTQTKTVALAPRVNVGDVCIEPYISVVPGAGGWWDIAGFQIDALYLECEFDCIVFKWGHIFDFVWPRMPGWGSTCCGACIYGPWYATETWRFTPKGVISRRDECAFTVHNGVSLLYPNEMFGFEYDCDSCCGGALTGGIYTFFDTTLHAASLFDWLATYIEVEAGIGSMVDVHGSLFVSYLGIEDVGFGFSLNF
jgi:hypothetical protein